MESEMSADVLVLIGFALGVACSLAITWVVELRKELP
jgi:ABC-type cobalamin transport system permease subunit